MTCGRLRSGGHHQPGRRPAATYIAGVGPFLAGWAWPAGRGAVTPGVRPRAGVSMTAAAPGRWPWRPGTGGRQRGRS